MESFFIQHCFLNHRKITSQELSCRIKLCPRFSLLRVFNAFVCRKVPRFLSLLSTKRSRVYYAKQMTDLFKLPREDRWLPLPSNEIDDVHLWRVVVVSEEEDHVLHKHVKHFWDLAALEESKERQKRLHSGRRHYEDLPELDFIVEVVDDGNDESELDPSMNVIMGPAQQHAPAAPKSNCPSAHVLPRAAFAALTSVFPCLYWDVLQQEDVESLLSIGQEYGMTSRNAVFVGFLVFLYAEWIAQRGDISLKTSDDIKRVVSAFPRVQGDPYRNEVIGQMLQLWYDRRVRSIGFIRLPCGLPATLLTYSRKQVIGPAWQDYPFNTLDPKLKVDNTPFAPVLNRLGEVFRRDDNGELLHAPMVALGRTFNRLRPYKDAIPHYVLDDRVSFGPQSYSKIEAANIIASAGAALLNSGGGTGRGTSGGVQSRSLQVANTRLYLDQKQSHYITQVIHETNAELEGACKRWGVESLFVGWGQVQIRKPRGVGGNSGDESAGMHAPNDADDVEEDIVVTRPQLFLQAVTASGVVKQLLSVEEMANLTATSWHGTSALGRSMLERRRRALEFTFTAVSVTLQRHATHAARVVEKITAVTDEHDIAQLSVLFERHPSHYKLRGCAVRCFHIDSKGRLYVERACQQLLQNRLQAGLNSASAALQAQDDGSDETRSTSVVTASDSDNQSAVSVAVRRRKQFGLIPWTIGECYTTDPTKFPRRDASAGTQLKLPVAIVQSYHKLPHPHGVSADRLTYSVMKRMLAHYWAELLKQQQQEIAEGTGRNGGPSTVKMTLHPEDALAALHVLRCHPDYYLSKRGCGVATVYVAKHKSATVDGPSFFVERVCGVTTDFSLKRCYASSSQATRQSGENAAGAPSHHRSMPMQLFDSETGLLHPMVPELDANSRLPPMMLRGLANVRDADDEDGGNSAARKRPREGREELEKEQRRREHLAEEARREAERRNAVWMEI